MANFANTDAGKIEAQDLIKTRMIAGVWINGHVGVDYSGNVLCRFQRYMSPTNPDYGAWVESRDDAAT